MLSLFTLQFVPEKDKLRLLNRIRDGLVPGGALFLAEKVSASSARLQDALAFPYYDYKLGSFTEKEILDKERSLRGQMTGWSQKELMKVLKSELGFRHVEIVWNDFPFTAVLALT
jgi:tRNA (cmo5U34)-methyltransferase